MKSVFLFLATFAVGAVATLAYRTARHEPHADHATHSGHAGHTEPAAAPAAAAPSPVSVSPAPAAATSGSKSPVNTVCAICGMDVDPKLPTAEYEGKTIGFGCRMCPSKFKADPAKYGPLYLRNEVVKR